MNVEDCLYGIRGESSEFEMDFDRVDRFVRNIRFNLENDGKDGSMASFERGDGLKLYQGFSLDGCNLTTDQTQYIYKKLNILFQSIDLKRSRDYQ